MNRLGRSRRVKTRTVALPASSKRSTKKQPQQPEDRRTSLSTLESQNPEIPTLEDLGLVGRLVVGSVQIVVTCAVEYATGFLGGYVLGGLVGVPGLLRPAAPAPLPFFNELGQRLARCNGKAVRWGSTWAPISAVYGGSEAAIRVIRGSQEDQWNRILSSAAAGAYFSRSGGPPGMVRGALMYGAITYMLTGGMSKQEKTFQYKEEAVEF